MPEKLKKFDEQPAEEQKRYFGKEEMYPVGEIKPLMFRGSKEKKGLGTIEVWESKSKCSCEGIGVTSTVRLDVFSRAWMNDGFIVYEVKNGKLLESHFDYKLEPVAGGTAPAPLVEEHRKKLEGFMKDEFNHQWTVKKD